MVLNYNNLKKYCTFCTEHIEFVDNKCSTVFSLFKTDKKTSYHKVDFIYNIHLNAWKPISHNENTHSFYIKGDLLNSTNVGVYNRHALGVNGLDENSNTCYLVFDDKTLLPVITKQPQTIDEMLEIIAVEPRLIKELPAVLNKKDRHKLVQACLTASINILKQNQPSNDSLLSKEESIEQSIYTQLCFASTQEYLAKCINLDKKTKAAEEPEA